MNVLITAGGTSEQIDSVRSITNHATGRLGSIIADKFAHENAAVTYVCSERAALPTGGSIEIIRIKNTQGLLEVMENLLETRKFDCVIHSMAVSDFTPQSALTLDGITESVLSAISAPDASKEGLSNVIRAAILASSKPLSDPKISSDSSDLMLLLKQTPKVIAMIKSKQPETLLVGFKLLSSATLEELMRAANSLLAQNSCDFVLANDLRDINDSLHKAFLLDSSGILHEAGTKQEISEIIYRAISERTAK
ncbi:MAG: phosphopantothenate--cysteine ligase [Oscillospiraceae bacterium]|nr:phosphopantothenate--cysteine ligase [Oscillospiraceae bacterium]